MVKKRSLVLFANSNAIKTPHTFTWLAHLRTGTVTCREGLMRLETPEFIVHDIASADGTDWFARREGTCEEVGFSFRGNDTAVLTALCVAPRLQPRQDLTAGWQFAWAASEADAKTLAETEFLGPRVNLADGPWFYNTPEDRPGFGVYRKSISLKTSAGARYFLRIPPLTMDLLLNLNGHWHEFRHGYEAAQILPNWLEVTAYLKKGRNQFVLISKSTLEMAVFGRFSLAELTATPAESRLEKTGPATYCLYRPGGSDQIAWQDAPTAFQLDTVSGTAAACISRCNGLLVALQAREMQTSEFHLNAAQPVDLSLDGNVLTLANLGSNNRITFAALGGCGELDLHPFPHLRWISGTPGFQVRLALPQDATATVFMNGRPVPVSARWEQGIVLAYEAPALETVAATGPVSIAELARIGALPVQLKIPFAPRILLGITSADWRLQLEALEAGRGLNQPELVAAAMDLLRREVETHEALPKRRDGDRVWYRLKAAAARFLGDAKVATAIPLLVRQLTNGDIYPARIACVDALWAIGTPEAIKAIRNVPDSDEWNTLVKSRQLTGGKTDLF